ncbi:MAG: protease modulator HflC [Candidatus Omnitrophica bacterium]|nr:protease modulator HflC [Candidatus Omnitrophota bacterium]MBU1925173.1 protease modulator HflC [Candidatus Omnitrophota bacterium]
MKKLISIILFLSLVVIVLAASGFIYTVDETQQVVITQFGQPIGAPVKDAGLHFKVPFIQQANYFEERILEWDGAANQIPTKDKKYIWVDATARWKIVDALKFLQSVTNEIGAHARLDDIIDSATRDFITSHNLVEAVRDTNRILDDYTVLAEAGSAERMAEELERIYLGREAITRGILQEASKIVPQYGIELIDVRVKRINYVSEVQKKVFERMISERKRAAEQYRSEGQGKRAEIEGQTQKELQQINSEAYKIAEEIKGKADAKAIDIYADAYNRDPDFYAFVKTLDTYKNTIDQNTTLILTTDTEYLKFLKDTKGNLPKQ